MLSGGDLGRLGARTLTGTLNLASTWHRRSARIHNTAASTARSAVSCPARCSLLCLCFSPGVSRAAPSPRVALSSRSSRRRLLHSPPPPATAIVQPRATLRPPPPSVLEHAAAVRCAWTSPFETRPRACCSSPTGLHRRPTPLSAASAPSRDGLCDDVAESPITQPPRLLHLNCPSTP